MNLDARNLSNVIVGVTLLGIANTAFAKISDLIEISGGSAVVAENTERTVITFLVTNQSGGKVAIDTAFSGRTFIPDPITPGDPSDTIRDRSVLFINGRDTCNGALLPKKGAAGSFCTFALSFATEDKSGTNNADFGTWIINPTITVKTDNEFGAVTASDYTAKTGAGKIVVFDPPVPEPSETAMLLIGLAALWRVIARARNGKTVTARAQLHEMDSQVIEHSARQKPSRPMVWRTRTD